METVTAISTALSIGSIALGLTAWAVPIVLILCKRGKQLSPFPFILSLTACATSLFLQILEIQNRAHAESWSAIADTIDTLSWVAAALLIITAVLNITALIRHKPTAND